MTSTLVEDLLSLWDVEQRSYLNLKETTNRVVLPVPITVLLVRPWDPSRRGHITSMSKGGRPSSSWVVNVYGVDLLPTDPNCGLNRRIDSLESVQWIERDGVNGGGILPVLWVEYLTRPHVYHNMCISRIIITGVIRGLFTIHNKVIVLIVRQSCVRFPNRCNS